jgi:hypothetical protein
MEKKHGLVDFMKDEKKEKNKRLHQGSSRHSRFGTCVGIKDKNSDVKRMVL